VSILASLYFLGLIFGDMTIDLLTISSHCSHLDSSFAVQKMNVGKPLVIIFLHEFYIDYLNPHMDVPLQNYHGTL
ncbi:MAG: hypothetical protein WA364_01785, partial [Candidatus Nitrosopolaris sp.]